MRAMAEPRLDDTAFTHTVAGRAVSSSSSFQVIDPSTGEAFAVCPDASRETLDAAVAAGRAAFPAWSALSFAERRERLAALTAAMRADAETLAVLLTREQGKPLQRARNEIERAARDIDAITQIAVEPQLLRESAAERIELHHRPLGVVGAITPWNVPVGLAAHKIGQALYSGSTLVLKPSPFTPLTTLRIGELAREVLPPGVLNVVAGGAELGAWLTAHPGVDKISFTGSGPTGRKVLGAAAGETLKRVTLELGGNDAAIVLADADLETAIPALFASAFGNSGQVCMATKRLYVHDSIYEEVVQALAARARAAKVGGGFEAGVEIGPVQNRPQYERVLDLLRDTRALPGVRILAGGDALPRPGYFIAPTVVADIEDGARLVDEEPFGPVLPVIRFSDADEALRRANASEFGLSGSVWTRDLEKGRALAARLEVGTAWVNRHGGADAVTPFGGAKGSGLGREHGLLGLQAYMEPQVLHLAL